MNEEMSVAIILNVLLNFPPSWGEFLEVET